MSEDILTNEGSGNTLPADRKDLTKETPADSSLVRATTVPLQETRIPPEFRDRARKLFSEEEFLEGVKEVQEKGGLLFEDFFDDLIEATRECRENA